MSEAEIKSITEEIVKQVEENNEKEKVKIDYKPAAEGDRQRPWVISNKIVSLGELTDDYDTKVFIPLISIYETDPKKVPRDQWVNITVKDKKYMVCRKTFLFMTNGVCEPLYDKSNTVVTHITVHSQEEQNTDRNKEFWKQQFQKYMRCGSLSWKEATKLYEDKGEESKDLETVLEDLSIGDSESKE